MRSGRRLLERHSLVAAVVLVVLATRSPFLWPAVLGARRGRARLYLALGATGLWITSVSRECRRSVRARSSGSARSPRRSCLEVGMAPLLAPLVGVLAAARRRPRRGRRRAPAAVFIAVTTWILTWTVFLALLAFPTVSGGAQGIVVPSRGLRFEAHYEGGSVKSRSFSSSLIAGVGALARRVGCRGSNCAPRCHTSPLRAAALGVATRASAARSRSSASAAIGGLAGGFCGPARGGRGCRRATGCISRFVSSSRW